MKSNDVCMHASFGFWELRFNLCVGGFQDRVRITVHFSRATYLSKHFFVFEMASVTIEGAVQIVPCTTFFSGVGRRFFSSFSTRVLNF